MRWLQAQGRVLFDRGGTPARMVGLMQDVTQRRQAEDELKRIERQLRQTQRLEAIGTLAGGIAHDFNNILGAILGYGERALRDVAKGSRRRSDLDSIMAAGERGRALVDRILARSRGGDEGVAVRVERAVREALDLLEAKMPKGRRVEAPATPRIRARLSTVSSRAREAGAVEVLKKPLSARELAASLAGAASVGDGVSREITGEARDRS